MWEKVLTSQLAFADLNEKLIKAVWPFIILEKLYKLDKF